MTSRVQKPNKELKNKVKPFNIFIRILAVSVVVIPLLAFAVIFIYFYYTYVNPTNENGRQQIQQNMGTLSETEEQLTKCNVREITHSYYPADESRTYLSIDLYSPSNKNRYEITLPASDKSELRELYDKVAPLCATSSTPPKWDADTIYQSPHQFS